MIINIDSRGVSARTIFKIAHDFTPVSISPDTAKTIAASYSCLQEHAASGQAIYGVSTGLGAAVDTVMKVRTGDDQHLIPRARAVGVGRIATEVEARAMIATRLSRVCVGHSGMSYAVAAALAGMLNHRIVPRVPMLGSVGEADLAPMAHIAEVLTGRGTVIRADGSLTDGRTAFLEAGLELPKFGVKDGLALVSSNSAALGLAALAIADVQRVFAAQVAAVALSYEGFRASIAPLAPAATALRPAPYQGTIAESLLSLLEGGNLMEPKAQRRLQDPLSLRCVSSVFGAVQSTICHARDAVALELATSDDNPAINTALDLVLPNGNFDPTHVALSFDTMALALARLAAMTGERIMKMMSAEMSDLPRFMAPDVGGSNGFATVQKTVSALVATIGQQAMPMPFAAIPVADRVEDYASLLMPGVEKFSAIVENLRYLVGIELMVAAQAVDLRTGITLGQGTAAIQQAVRALVAPLTQDRAASPDIVALAEAIQQQRLGPILTELEEQLS
ncbi:histidine ammonia-lyase [Roseovarius mucosus]|uniref:Histidine ammonia-lyase n=1 Tax=Roseovarius mucosus TaxID=215743 RepID=A0A1V0RMQ0_9RHOB|nr:aromatic amino acid lyase [Roseovarius mucosus]ARE83064.1 histidine ammonia-lyase [Roseovarius mucosus]